MYMHLYIVYIHTHICMYKCYRRRYEFGLITLINRLADSTSLRLRWIDNINEDKALLGRALRGAEDVTNDRGRWT